MSETNSQINTAINPIRWRNGATALNDSNLNTISDNITSLTQNDTVLSNQITGLSEHIESLEENLTALNDSIYGGSASDWN